MALTPLPPDAAERDAARRAEAGTDDGILRDADFAFHTRGVTDAERAAIIAVFARVREEETQRVKRVERREREPWVKSQRTPEGIEDLLAEG